MIIMSIGNKFSWKFNLFSFIYVFCQLMIFLFIYSEFIYAWQNKNIYELRPFPD